MQNYGEIWFSRGEPGKVNVRTFLALIFHLLLLLVLQLEQQLIGIPLWPLYFRGPC